MLPSNWAAEVNKILREAAYRSQWRKRYSTVLFDAPLYFNPLNFHFTPLTLIFHFIGILISWSEKVMLVLGMEWRYVYNYSSKFSLQSYIITWLLLLAFSLSFKSIFYFLFQVFFAVSTGSAMLGQIGASIEALAAAKSAAYVIFSIIDRVNFNFPVY